MVSCLGKLDSEIDEKGFLHCILEFHFLVTLVLVTGVFLVTTVLSTKLQYKTIDLNDAATYSKAAVRQLQGWVNEVSNDAAVDDQEEEEKQQHNPPSQFAYIYKEAHRLSSVLQVQETWP